MLDRCRDLVQHPNQSRPMFSACSGKIFPFYFADLLTAGAAFHMALFWWYLKKSDSLLVAIFSLVVNSHLAFQNSFCGFGDDHPRSVAVATKSEYVATKSTARPTAQKQILPTPKAKLQHAYTFSVMVRHQNTYSTITSKSAVLFRVQFGTAKLAMSYIQIHLFHRLIQTGKR